MDLEALIEQLRRGDPSAGPILVSIVAPRLLGYAAHLARDLGEAAHEEIVEAAIEKSISKIDQFDAERGTFTGWVRTFVRNEVATWRRHHPGATVPLNEEALEVAGEPEPDEDEVEVEVASQRDTAITALVLGLTEPAQLLLRLRFAEGLDHIAIAEALGVRPDAARKRLQRILQTLRQQAADDPDLKRLGGE